MGATDRAPDQTYEAVIGLEVHLQLCCKSKIFCGCATDFGAPPNTQICPVCSGQPGALPVLNETVVEYAVSMALALGCTVRQRSRFARKNYFYPDMPKGYQISQYDQPLAEHGSLVIDCDGLQREVGITRVHLEDDAGKTIHDAQPGVSLVDLNRAGVPLIEIVSEPDIRTPKEAAEYMRTLRSIARYLGVSDGNMQEGSLRCDANISLRPLGQAKLGTKVEIKNINSFRFVQRALEYEIERQRDRLDRGQTVTQETRLWNSEQGRTEAMRHKEEAHDYRYFPDPDLPPLVVEDALLEKLQAALPQLPQARCGRYQDEFGLPAKAANALTRERELAEYFEAVVAAGAQATKAANWLLSELLSQVADARQVADFSLPPKSTAELLQMVDQGKISGKLAKEIWAKMLQSGKSAPQIAQEENLFQQSDPQQLEREVQRVLADNPEKVAQYRKGKGKLLGFFVGQVMRATGKKANPQLVNQLLKKHLDEK